jgi:hypothetical protein
MAMAMLVKFGGGVACCISTVLSSNALLLCFLLWGLAWQCIESRSEFNRSIQVEKNEG